MFKLYGSNMFECSVCGKAFGRLGNLQRHTRNLHDSASGPSNDRPSSLPSTTTTRVESRPCFNELVDDDDIFEHGREILECEYCARYFLDQEQLDRHEKVYLI